MTESSSWPTEYEELAKHVLDRLDEFPYPVLTNLYRESDRDQSVLRLSTYYDGELYGSEMVMPDENVSDLHNGTLKDQFDRQLQAMGGVLEEAGADGHWYGWGMSTVERAPDTGGDVGFAQMIVASREPRVRGIDSFDCTIVDESANGDRVRVSCIVGEQTIGETVRVDEDLVRVKDAMDALEQRALGLMQKHD